MKNLSKTDIETGRLPIGDLLRNSLYYPACWTDGSPIKYFNERYGEFGINSFVYVDYIMSAEKLSQEEETFRHYHIFASRDLSVEELTMHGRDYMSYASVLSAEERLRYKEIVLEMHKDLIQPFARWIVYERDDDAPADCGPERFSLLYIGGEGVATYAALYRCRDIAPKVLAIIRPGTGFGGNYTNFNDANSALMKIINDGTQRPEYLLGDNNELTVFNNSYYMGTYKDTIRNLVDSQRSKIKEGHSGYNILENYGQNIKKIEAEAKNNKAFLDTLAKLKGPVTREYIAQLYRNGALYEAFVTTILWGNLNMANIIPIIAQDVTTIEKKLEAVKNFIDNNQIKEAFQSMCHKKGNKIDHIGISFFTKVLYFMGYDKISNMPLIYDRWTQCIHAALMQSEGQNFNEFFTIYHKTNGNLTAPKMHMPAVDLYMDYLQRMKVWADELQISRPDKLEEFLFGSSIRIAKTWTSDNPRRVLCEYLSQFCECAPQNGESEENTQNSSNERCETFTKVRKDCAYIYDRGVLKDYNNINWVRYIVSKDKEVVYDQKSTTNLNFFKRGTLSAKVHRLLSSDAYNNRREFPTELERELIDGEETLLVKISV